MQLQRDVGILGGIGRGGLQRHLVEADLLRALARHFLVLDGLHAQVAQREAIHVVRAMRFEHVGLEQRVVLDAVQRDLVVGEHLRVVLEMLADLPALGTLQPGLQLRQHLVARQLLGRVGAAMRDRDVGRAAGLGRQRDADDLRNHRIERGGFGVEGGQLGRLDLRQPGVELRPGLHGLVVALDGGGRRHRLGRRFARRHIAGRVGRRGLELAPPGLEAVVLEDRQQRLARFAERGQRGLDRFHLRLQLAGRLDCHQLARERQEVERAAQVVADHALDLGRMLDDAVERLVLREPLDGRLRAALLDAGHVVDGVADQREIVDDALGRHAELGDHAFAVEQFVAHGIDQRDPLRHQLGEILVAGRDHHLHAARLGGMRERADHVVGLDALDHQQRPAERAHRLVDRLDL